MEDCKCGFEVKGPLLQGMPPNYDVPARRLHSGDGHVKEPDDPYVKFADPAPADARVEPDIVDIVLHVTMTPSSPPPLR